MNATTTTLKLAFAGTPDFAVPCLQALIDSPHDIVMVYTQPDKQVGRGRKLSSPPVKHCAVEANLTVSQPKNFRQPEIIAQLKALQLDALIVVAYGHILPTEVLSLPRLGCINVHASLLPRWRGAAPIQAALLAGDNQTGITTMQMDVGLDTGDMLQHASIPIMPDDTGGSLHDKLAELGAQTLIQTLADLSKGNIQPQQQNETLATYAPKIDKADAQINWQNNAEFIARQIRAYNPWPVCFSALDGLTIRIWQAHATNLPTAQAAPGEIIQADKTGLFVATGNGVLQITSLQLPGKSRCDFNECLHGHAPLFTANARFGFDDA